MHRLGGAVISSADMQASSAAKGESLADTVRVVAGYAEADKRRQQGASFFHLYRTKEQVGDINRVLDGDIDMFIKTY